MDNVDEYTLELKTKGLDEQEQKELLAEIEEEFGIEFTEDKEIEELEPIDPGFIIATYSAAIGTLSLFLRLYIWNQEEDVPAEIGVRHSGQGNIYVIHADEVKHIGATVLEENNDIVAAELNSDEVREIRKMREKVDE